MADDRHRVWEERYREGATEVPPPARVLGDFRHLLPARGEALDLACGRGGNAVALARAGLTAHAWDYSETAIEGLRRAAAGLGVRVEARVRDVIAEPPEPERFDVIVVARFLHRPLAPALVQALRPGGLLFYQTFTRERLSGRGPGNPDFRLRENELLRLFAPLRLVAYREEGTFGAPDAGFRDEAMLIGARRG